MFNCGVDIKPIGLFSCYNIVPTHVPSFPSPCYETKGGKNALLFTPFHGCQIGIEPSGHLFDKWGADRLRAVRGNIEKKVRESMGRHSRSFSFSPGDVKLEDPRHLRYTYFPFLRLWLLYISFIQNSHNLEWEIGGILSVFFLFCSHNSNGDGRSHEEGRKWRRHHDGNI